MKYKTRENLQQRMDAAYEAAKQKEGREITVTPVVEKIKKQEIAYQCRDGILLNDGSYLTNIQNTGSEVSRFSRIENLPVETLKAMVDLDHEVDTLMEREELHMDYSYQNYLARKDSDEPILVDPLDRHAYLNWYGNPEDIVIHMMCREPKLPPLDFGELSTPPEIGYTSDGRFNEKTMQMLKRIAAAFLHELPEKRRDDALWLWESDIMQKDLAEIKGVSEAAVSKKKNKIARDLADMLRDLGYPVPEKSELKEEKEKRKSYEEHYKSASMELKKQYCPDEEDEAEETA